MPIVFKYLIIILIPRHLRLMFSYCKIYIGRSLCWLGCLSFSLSSFPPLSYCFRLSLLSFSFYLSATLSLSLSLFLSNAFNLPGALVNVHKTHLHAQHVLWSGRQESAGGTRPPYVYVYQKSKRGNIAYCCETTTIMQRSPFRLLNLLTPTPTSLSLSLSHCPSLFSLPSLLSLVSKRRNVQTGW